VVVLAAFAEVEDTDEGFRLVDSLARRATRRKLCKRVKKPQGQENRGKEKKEKGCKSRRRGLSSTFKDVTKKVSREKKQKFRRFFFCYNFSNVVYLSKVHHHRLRQFRRCHQTIIICSVDRSSASASSSCIIMSGCSSHLQRRQRRQTRGRVSRWRFVEVFCEIIFVRQTGLDGRGVPELQIQRQLFERENKSSTEKGSDEK